MGTSHRMTHAFRAALLVVAGSALIAGPMLLGLGAAAMVSGVLIGAIAVALGVAGTEPGSRGSLPMSAQLVYDRGLALGLIVSAGIFGIADQPEAALLFAGAGLTALVMTSLTRYSAGTA